MNNLTILINSCKKFSDMWGNILDLYSKYWRDHPELIIVSDELDRNFNFNCVHPYTGDMSDRMLLAALDVKTKFVFLSFDDYYPKSKVDVDRISKIINLMESNNFDYCRMFKEPKAKGKKIGELKYKNLPLTRTYEVNFYPCIWKVESLIKIIKRNETIWKLEARITRRSKENGYKCIAIRDKTIFPFVDVVRKGKYLRNAYRFLKKNKLYISDRPVRTIKETTELAIQTFLSNNMPRCIKDRIKEKMRKKGRVYYSDYADTDD